MSKGGEQDKLPVLSKRNPGDTIYRMVSIVSNNVLYI